jgi:hypothetical protein
LYPDVGGESPPPPMWPQGWLWQPAQELASGPETRLKARGPARGLAGSERARPFPFVSGRPPPSCSVQLAVNRLRP